MRRYQCAQSIAMLALLFLAAHSLLAQPRDTVRSVDTVRSGEWRVGPQFLSAELNCVAGDGLTWGLFGDLHFIRYTSEVPVGMGLRVGGERSESMFLLDYAYTDYHADLLARLTLGKRWIRLDLYGGYAFVSHNYAGFNIPWTNKMYHLLDLGIDFKIMLISNIVGLMARYSVAGNAPLGGSSRSFSAGGLGLSVGWGPLP